MKNIGIFIFAFSIFIASCDSVETPDEVKEETLFSMTIPDNFYTQQSSYNISEHLYATDEDGHLIADTALSNNSTFTLKAFYDITNKAYDITYLSKLEINGITNYFIYTFPDALHANYTRVASSSGSRPEATVRIENTGNNVEYNAGVGNLSSSSSNADGGWLEIEYDLFELPGNFYVTVRGGGDTDWRYLWINNINENDIDTVQYNDLPILPTPTIVNLPTNTNLSYEIVGYTSPMLSNGQYLLEVNENQGLSSIEQSIPQNIFTHFKRTVSMLSNGKSYRTIEQGSSINTTYTLPSFDYQLVDTFLANFELTSNDNYDYYGAFFKLDMLAQNYKVRWYVYGKGENLVNLKFPNDLETDIFTQHPSFSVSKLSFLGSSIVNAEGLENFEDYVGYILGASTYNERMTKYERLYKN